MNLRLLYKKSILVTLILIMVLVHTGCTKQDWLDLVDFGRSWAQSNGILNKEGKPTWSTLGRATLGVSTGNDTVDAAIDAGLVVSNFTKAEKLSEAGVKEHDIDKVDQAIQLRPKDYSYRNQKAAMLFFQSDDANAQAEFSQANALSQSMNSSAYVRNIQSRIDNLKREYAIFESKYDASDTISDAVFADRTEKYKTTLAKSYKELYDLTGDEQYHKLSRKSP